MQNLDLKKACWVAQKSSKILIYAAIGAATGTLAAPGAGTAFGYLIGVGSGIYSMKKNGDK